MELFVSFESNSIHVILTEFCDAVETVSLIQLQCLPVLIEVRNDNNYVTQ